MCVYRTSHLNIYNLKKISKVSLGHLAARYGIHISKTKKRQMWFLTFPTHSKDS